MFIEVGKVKKIRIRSQTKVALEVGNVHRSENVHIRSRES